MTVEVTALFGISGDVETSRRLAQVETMQGNFAAAESLLRQIVATSNRVDDHNGLAWLSLFRGNVTDSDIAAASRAVALGRNSDYPSLHTLAALYAETGKTAEALQIIHQAMAANGSEEMSSSDWYVLGRIYEQLGEQEASVNAYQRVVQPKEPAPTADYALAQRRLRAMGR